MEYEGAVVLISHDRALLEAVGSRTIVCEDGKLASHDSGWAEYQRRRDERESAASAAAKPAAASGGGKGGKYSATSSAEKAAKKAAKLEQRIERAEAKLREVEEELADPAAWANPDRAAKAEASHKEAKRDVEQLLEKWEEVQVAAEST
jgi:ATP-binding cassette subfamily F protein 3